MPCRSLPPILITEELLLQQEGYLPPARPAAGSTSSSGSSSSGEGEAATAAVRAALAAAATMQVGTAPEEQETILQDAASVAEVTLAADEGRQQRRGGHRGASFRSPATTSTSVEAGPGAVATLTGSPASVVAAGAIAAGEGSAPDNSSAAFPANAPSSFKALGGGNAFTLLPGKKVVGVNPYASRARAGNKKKDAESLESRVSSPSVY